MSTPRQSPNRIELLPFDHSELPVAYRWCQQCWSQVADDAMPRDEDVFIEYWRAKTNSGGSAMMGVYRNGELGGFMAITAIGPGVGEGHCVFKKGIDRRDSFWGHDTTVPALEEAKRIAFAPPFNFVVIECEPFFDNYAMIKLLERVGARYQGPRFSKHQRDGKRIDVVSYALLRED